MHKHNSINYNSTKYQIAFEYPSDWTVEEKTNRFEEGPSVTVSDLTGGGLLFTVGYTEKKDFTEYLGGTNVVSATRNSFKGLMNVYDYPYEFIGIESPTFNSTIDGQRAGTYVYTTQDKSESYSTKMASQAWTVFVGDHGYYLGFGAPTDIFDSPEATEIRDHFIESIKFLDTENISNDSNNQTSRFT